MRKNSPPIPLLRNFIQYGISPCTGIPPLIPGLSLILILLLILFYFIEKKINLSKNTEDPRPPQAPPVENVENSPFSPNTETYFCIQCGEEIPEHEFEEFSGLCKKCRGISIQENFPSPPGFPKLS